MRSSTWFETFGGPGGPRQLDQQLFCLEPIDCQDLPQHCLGSYIFSAIDNRQSFAVFKCSENNFLFFPSNTCSTGHSHESIELQTKPWETGQAEEETGEDSGEDSEAEVTAVTAEGAEEVTVSSLCIHRFTRCNKTRMANFPPREEILRVRQNL